MATPSGRRVILESGMSVDVNLVMKLKLFAPLSCKG